MTRDKHFLRDDRVRGADEPVVAVEAAPGKMPTALTGAQIAHEFAHVATWVFDLDNTLYPASSDLWPKIDARITLFMMELFGLDGMSSRALQKYYYERYGTTLRGLMEEHEITAGEFLKFVHDIDRSSLVPNHSLATAITALPGRKLILTNGSREHALRTAEQLGLDKMFEDVFDIVASDLMPKPNPQAYERFFEKHGVDPAGAAIFEDIERNLVVPHSRGMRTTLVVPKPGQHDHRDPWEVAKERPGHVDYVTDDLEEFLTAIMREAPAAKNTSG
jgi:putative hydrolase of the HAD superfamily